MAKTIRGEVPQFVRDLVADPPDPVECVRWPYAMLGPVDGYGAIGPNHFGSISASRSVLIHATGRNPQHLEAAHSCGNRWCVNLAHLRWATVAENHSDKIGHGTTLRGERNHQTKLSDAQVAEIRAMCAAGGRGTQRQAAAMFGIGEAQVSRIVNRVQRR